MTTDQIRQLADEYLRDTLREREARRAAGEGIPAGPGELRYRIKEQEEQANNLRAMLTYGHLVAAAQETAAYLMAHHHEDIDLDLDSPEFNQLVREIVKRKIRATEIESQRLQGDYSDEYATAEHQPHVSPMATGSIQHAVAPGRLQGADKQSPLLSEVIPTYIADCKRRGGAKEATIKEYEDSFNLLVRVLGDKRIGEVDKDAMRFFLDTLQQLPKHSNKKPEYRGKTIAEIVAMPGGQRISDTTVKGYMERVARFLGWCVTEGHLPKNPAEGLTPKKKKGLKKASEERNAFDRDDLMRMLQGFTQAQQAGDLQGRPERAWIPLIGLFSGMRLNEICQLHTPDIQQTETGVWYFDIETQEGDDKSVKSAAGRRRVPVHPVLIALGFLEYYRRVQEVKAPRLWMNLTRTQKGYHRRFSNWFLGVKAGGGREYGGFLRQYVTTDPLKNFHSFRHTFTNDLKQRLIETTIINELVGHAHGNLSLDRYGKGLAVETLAEAVQQVDYGVDFGELKGILAGLEPVQ